MKPGRLPAEFYVGEQRGAWTIVRKALPAELPWPGAHHGWHCRCSCGTERIVRATSLVTGRSRSCNGAKHPELQGAPA